MENRFRLHLQKKGVGCVAVPRNIVKYLEKRKRVLAKAKRAKSCFRFAYSIQDTGVAIVCISIIRAV
jgi:hypothetical protein